MHAATCITTIIATLLPLSTPAALPSPKAPTNAAPTIKTLTNFTSSNWIENLAIRSNGQILATSTTSPTLYLIDPFTTPPTTEILATLPHYSSLTGITETTKDHFTFLAVNASEGLPIAGTYSVFNLNIKPVTTKTAHSSLPSTTIEKLVDVPEGKFLNGVVKLCDEEVLISDSTAGVVYKLNVKTGEYTVVLQDDSMNPPANATLPIGINGIQIRDSVLYYTNTETATLWRVPINSDGSAAGDYKKVASDIAGDDFAFDKQGNIVCADDLVNGVVLVDVADGEIVTIAGSVSSTEVAGPTSVKFGRTRVDSEVAYVTFNGGLGAPINGTVTVPGGVLAVDVSQFLGEY